MRVGLVTPKVTHPRNRKITDTENSIVEVRGTRRCENRVATPTGVRPIIRKFLPPWYTRTLVEGRRGVHCYISPTMPTVTNLLLVRCIIGYSSLSRALLALRFLSPAALCRKYIPGTA